MILAQDTRTGAVRVHPLYAENIWEWTFSWISFLGGRYYLFPPIPYSNFDLERTVVRGQSEADAGPLPNSMLERNGREENPDYTARIRRAVYVNLVAPIVRARVAHVLDSGVQRVAPPAMAAYLDDVDMAAHARDPWMREGLVQAGVFGHAYALTEIPAIPLGVEPASAAEALELGQRPYSVWISPLDLIDWQVDDRGRFEWAVVRYQDETRPPPSLDTAVSLVEQRWQPTTRYRVWEPERWRDYQQERTEFGLHAGPVRFESEGVNPLGRVPIDTLYNLPGRHGRQPIGTSAVLDAAYLNRKHYNLTSWIDDQTASQTFAQLAVPVAGKNVLGRLQLGIHRFFGYNPGAGGAVPSYFSPPTAPTELLIREVQRLEAQLRATAGMSRGVAEESIAARPAEALAFETADKAAELRAAVSEAEQFEVRQLRTVAEWMRLPSDARIEVRYGQPQMSAAEAPVRLPVRAAAEVADEAQAEGQAAEAA